GLRRQLAETVVEELLGADEQHLVPLLLLQLAERHPVFLEEADELLPGDAAVLAAGDAVALEAAGVEPLRNRPGRDLTDLGHLSGCEHLFHRETLRLNSLDPCAPPGGRPPSVACGAGPSGTLGTRGESGAAVGAPRPGSGALGCWGGLPRVGSAHAVGPGTRSGSGRQARPRAPHRRGTQYPGPTTGPGASALSVPMIVLAGCVTWV